EVGDLPYGHTYGLRHISGEPVPMSDEEVATAEALRAEYERLEQAHSESDELPEEVDQRLGEIETALEALEERPVKYDPEEVARGGVFISIDGSGALRVERGYVRPEDEPAVAQPEPEGDTQANSIEAASSEATKVQDTTSLAPEERDEEEQGIKPIP